MGRRKVSALLLLIVFFGGFCCASAASPARFASVLFSNLLSALWRRIWSATTDSRIAISSRSNVKFESGYSVETVFYGSRHGIEPFSVEVMPGGVLLVLDSENSNIYKISLPLSKYSRPKLVAGSAYGSSGHVDGKPREARMNHPKGLTVDDKGNIYVADAKNKAIRKISDSGVTTIAVGKSYRVGSIGLHIEDAKFSDDFEVVYASSSCSLLVVDRGNQAIREIHLNFDDCADQYGARLSLGIAMLFAAAFFGYMLALVQRRWVVVASSSHEEKTTTRSYSASPHHQPLIPPETETEKQEDVEGFFTSLKEITASAAASIAPIFGRILSRRNTPSHLRNQQPQQEDNVWPLQESLVVPDEEPPPFETQTHSPRKTYAFMSKNSEKLQQLQHDTAYFTEWGGVERHNRSTT
ncbi:uncharacterized protein LOC122032134 [Zingiber officinale]|uniref:Teneurin NHL domain-containing protein n=1 Tax=Zingiber officinale TaxID=94328 RepID=A0A8J5C7B9_ZINOF|nr:uncharacterized protein LOC122032134 [Zingiber officinale]XP_042447325.1 uncharacterized protein LOC122032134 [Zingiber officinale]XP_042447326.1 uncharacterized protein LOC122032134 [Zingiber officinale]KAG6469674.1 hypothetical protein ZIOFF_070604 [Zingiber officinale]